MIKRVFLFLLTNLAVIATLSILMNVLGLHGYLTSRGLDYKSLAIFAAIWGTGGAFISLLMSRFVAKTAMGVKLIDPKTTSPEERSLLQIVYRLAHKTGLKTMPEVGVYDSPELNAFATGPTRNKALVAVSTGLLGRMNQEEVESVLGHEISHVGNGDMVTLTLILGIVNAFALFFSRIIAYAITIAMARNENQGPSPLFFVLTLVFDIMFTLLGNIVVAAFSRHREYRADYGGAKLVGKLPMISALQTLQQYSKIEDPRAPSIATLKINYRPGLTYLFATHPPIEERIKRLESSKLL